MDEFKYILPIEFQMDGFVYKQIVKSDRAVVYVRIGEYGVLSYDIFKLILGATITVGGYLDYPATNTFLSDYGTATRIYHDNQNKQSTTLYDAIMLFHKFNSRAYRLYG